MEANVHQQEGNKLKEIFHPLSGAHSVFLFRKRGGWSDPTPFPLAYAAASYISDHYLYGAPTDGRRYRRTLLRRLLAFSMHAIDGSGKPMKLKVPQLESNTVIGTVLVVTTEVHWVL